MTAASQQRSTEHLAPFRGNNDKGPGKHRAIDLISDMLADKRAAAMTPPPAPPAAPKPPGGEFLGI